MHPSAIGLIALRRELAARYARLNRLWVTARNGYRRLNEAAVPNLNALREAGKRLDELERGRMALRRDLKALSD
jgi:hypothetical protein